MFTSMRIKNFKSWKDTRPIRLAPLTVLFGANSAGKSSLLQLLLLLKQTAASRDLTRTLNLGDDSTLTDVGNYEDAVHNHDLTQRLEFELSWTIGEPLTFRDPLANDKKIEGNAFKFSVAIVANKQSQPTVSTFTYQLLDSVGKCVTDLSMNRQDGDEKFDIHSTHYKLKRHLGRKWPLPPPHRFYGFPDETIAYYQNAAFASLFSLNMERMLRSVYYIGPLREFPKPIYPWSGETPDHAGERGGKSIEAILASGDRSFNFKNKQRTKKLPELVASQLLKMGMIHEFKIQQLADGRKEYEVLVKTGAKRPDVKLTNIGFGVSQILPVIVECFYVPPRSVVIFEQPEIHLHPKVQADLADLFVDAICARENRLPRECQYIIESHSEHFLLRLQRRIAEESLAAQNVAIHFIKSETDAASIEELKVDPYGNILNWPAGFFGDEMKDLVARTEAQARRIKRGKDPK